MNELDYYTIKNLIRKVTNNIDNFKVADKGILELDFNGMYSIKPLGLRDLKTNLEILEKDFTRRIKPAFTYLYGIIADKEVEKYRNALNQEKITKIQQINNYLETTQYCNN